MVIGLDSIVAACQGFGCFNSFDQETVTCQERISLSTWDVWLLGGSLA